MNSSEVLVERIARTTIVSIHRPEARNAITRGVAKGLREAIEQASADKSVRCVVITGSGGHFCAGADLRKNLMENPDLLSQADVYLEEYHDIIRAIVRCSKPTVAMLDGAAVGFGADIGFACDLRVASTNAYMQESFVKIGLMPDGGGTFWLPRLIGTARAMKAILLAEKMDAKMLEDLGVILQTVPANELRNATMALAQKLEGLPPLAIEALKRAVYASWGDIDAALAREREGQLRLLRSADAMEGVLAWAQKRTPEFTGA